MSDRDGFQGRDAELYPQSVDLSQEAPLKFPFEAFEFEDPQTSYTPEITLKSPWKFKIESELHVDSDLHVEGDVQFGGTLTVERINALDSGGLSLYDDDGNLGLKILDGGVVYVQDSIGIGKDVPQAPIHIGTGSTNSVDAQVIVSRNVSGASGNAHCFTDSSDVNRNGSIGYNSFDARITFSGSYSYNHYAAFQVNPVYGSTGTLSKLYGLYFAPAPSSGTIGDVYGVYVSNFAGGGSVTNVFGLFVNELTKGSSKNYGFWIEGSTMSNYIEGRLGIGYTTPTHKLELRYSDSGLGYFAADSDLNSPVLYLNKSAANKVAELRLLTAGTMKWAFGISDSDNLGSGDEFFIGTSSGGASPAFYIDQSGHVYMPQLYGSATAGQTVQYSTASGHLYYQTSSRRYKRDIRDVAKSQT